MIFRRRETLAFRQATIEVTVLKAIGLSTLSRVQPAAYQTKDEKRWTDRALLADAAHTSMAGQGIHHHPNQHDLRRGSTKFQVVVEEFLEAAVHWSVGSGRKKDEDT